jgi:hypothetical protein
MQGEIRSWKVSPHKAFSLHVGLNRVDPNHYGGWQGILSGCEYDANDMATLAVNAKFTEVKTLLSQSATSHAVLAALKDYCARAVPGDLIVFTNSSHGGQVPDENGDEADAADETICMFDREIVDDELAAVWATAKPGVRILSISDSCHSGTLLRVLATPNHLPTRAVRLLPSSIATITYANNRAVYDPILQDPKLREHRGQVQASVLHIGACQDGQLSYDGARNGLFTEKLKQVWGSGRFVGAYGNLVARIRQLMPSDERPDFRYVGPRDLAFEGSQPFSF